MTDQRSDLSENPYEVAKRTGERVCLPEDDELFTKMYCGSYWLAGSSRLNCLVRVEPQYPLPRGCYRITRLPARHAGPANFVHRPIYDAHGCLMPEFWALPLVFADGRIG